MSRSHLPNSQSLTTPTPADDHASDIAEDVSYGLLSGQESILGASRTARESRGRSSTDTAALAGRQDPEQEKNGAGPR